eukprot:TRINITY_DN30419_c0_g1_i3.p1 TRINITY_DN30419_c0_g1~~TRINITY_DN30419_c0_g1_i3.p1  ORF type:complete len:334 (-),score=31.39 TRINITY_DN30419_c0_g1_i3:181-1182(-)
MLIMSQVAYLLDLLVYYFFGISFCFFTCGWRSYCKSISYLKPYRDGPFVLFYWNDIVTCLVGQVWRQGILESNVLLMNMWLVNPWLKYYINCNPWTHPLEPRMITQISTSMQDMSLGDLSMAILQIISRTKQTEALQADIDQWWFVPHYPYPPPWRRWAVGMQMGGPQLPACIFLLVHTTHVFCQHGGVSEQFVLSNSAAVSAYRVVLWYNNPYHFLTGYVEASLTDGIRGSQPDKNRGAEHPMWLVTSRSPMLSSRKSIAGTGWIDHFFDKWLPRIVDAMRRINLGHDAMEALKEEVISKDGSSRPAQGNKVPLVDPGRVDYLMYSVVNKYQ